MRQSEGKLPLSDAAPQIAAAMLIMVRQHRSAPPVLQRYYYTCLKWMARELEQFVQPRVSEAAQALASKKGLGDLRAYRYTDQPVAMRDPGRAIFHWEHIIPTSDMVNSILALDEPTIASIGDVLIKAQVAWITKEEDKRLPVSRRADPAQCYADAGARLLPEK